MARHNLLGAWGEAEAARYLRRRFYTLVAQGYRSRFGEIDLVAQNWKYLVFVEVKVRKDDTYGQSEGYVGWRKQEQLRDTAAVYLSRHPTKRHVRFDVIEIFAPQGCDTKKPVIRHIKEAFQ